MQRPPAFHALACHPSSDSAFRVEARAWPTESSALGLEFQLRGPVKTLVLPDPSTSQRKDRLWTSTCFELFAQTAGGPGYLEFNLAPSSDWAAYRFDAYRAGGRDATDCRLLDFTREAEPKRLSISALFAFSEPSATQTRIGLSAILETLDGAKSYWALAHPPGAPDFHHAVAFATTL